MWWPEIFKKFVKMIYKSNDFFVFESLGLALVKKLDSCSAILLEFKKYFFLAENSLQLTILASASGSHCSYCLNLLQGLLVPYLQEKLQDGNIPQPALRHISFPHRYHGECLLPIYRIRFWKILEPDPDHFNSDPQHLFLRQRTVVLNADQ